MAKKKRGKSFLYYDAQNREVHAQAIPQRIARLNIPPNWKEVWICPKENGHIQATGYDAAGRKQYLYHELWTSQQQQYKFDKLWYFGQQVPKIRCHLRKDLKETGWSKNKIIALVLSLIDEHFFLRVGNRRYRKRNGTVGAQH